MIDEDEISKPFVVYLYFPKATKYPYKISYTEAIQSEFIKNVLEIKQVNNPNFYYFKIEIPYSFYAGIRNVDIEHLIDLLIGKSRLFETQIKCDDSLCNYKAISTLTSALIINKDLNFIKLLSKYYEA